MKHTLRVTIIIVALFLLAQIVGLAVANSYVDRQATRESGKVTMLALPSVLGVTFERPTFGNEFICPQQPAPTTIGGQLSQAAQQAGEDLSKDSSYYVIPAIVVVGTVLILLIMKFNLRILWKLWFLFAIMMCLSFAFGAWLPGAAAFGLGLLLALWKVFKPNIIVHNLTEIFIYGGLVSIFIAVVSLWAAFALLVIISLYDMYAVWKSKHMVSLANFQKDTGLFAGLMVQYSRGTQPARKEGTGTTRKEETANVQSAVLGGGDIGFPLIFATALFINKAQMAMCYGATADAALGKGLLAASMVPLFAGIALFILLMAAKKDRFYPAMPFITLGCMAGWILSFLF